MHGCYRTGILSPKPRKPNAEMQRLIAEEGFVPEEAKQGDRMNL